MPNSLAGKFVSAAAAVTLAISCSALAAAGEPTNESEPTAATSALPEGVASLTPEVRVDTVDQDRLKVRRIDIVDDNGVIRMTLAGNLPRPVIDGVEWERSHAVGGLMLRDDKGNERGGFGYASGLNGVIFALDHNNGEAAGFNVLRNGSTSMMLIARPSQDPDRSLGNRIRPGESPTPFIVTVKPSGTAEMTLNDSKDRPRLRLSLDEDGQGFIEFLDADGRSVGRISPETMSSNPKP